MVGVQKIAKIMAEKNQNHEIESEDLPQVVTESYGTGVKDLPGYNVGQHSLESGRQEHTESSPEFPAEYTVVSNELDTYWQDTVGDEAVGGTAPTPDQNVTEEIEAAVGLEMDDFAFLRTNEILEERDDARWELDPKSAEDYQERRE
ncbi:hypothetical protein NIES4074_34900 [Cylindrospermum sp. NIES-4074]|jgi:hypothetical protein|nr:hypothetical protein NIES4074_34900 [Cylindrospermum sp. NIES-4074]